MLLESILPCVKKNLKCILIFSHTMFSNITAQKMKFPINDFFSKCDQIRSFLRIWSHLMKKSLMEHFIFCAVYCEVAPIIMLPHTLGHR